MYRRQIVVVNQHSGEGEEINCTNEMEYNGTIHTLFLYYNNRMIVSVNATSIGLNQFLRENKSSGNSSFDDSSRHMTSFSSSRLLKRCNGFFHGSHSSSVAISMVSGKWRKLFWLLVVTFIWCGSLPSAADKFCFQFFTNKFFFDN